MSALRVGIVGVGAIAIMGHLESYAKSDDVEIVAFVDIETQRVVKLAQDFSLKTGRSEPHVYARVEDMFRLENIDAVSICTPNKTHHELILKALEHGAHVLVEKPLCITTVEADQIVRAVDLTQKIVMVGMTNRYRTEVEALKRFVDAGDLGDIYYGKVRLLRRRGVPTGWFTDQSISGGGPLMDLGVHALDLAWWLMGMPEVLSANGFMTKAIDSANTDFTSTWSSLSADNEKNQVFTTEDFASAFLRFENGSVLQMEVAWALNGQEDSGLHMELFGTQGGISLSPLQVYRTDHGVLTTTELNVSSRNMYEREIAHFIESVKTGQQPLSDAKQGREVIQMLQMISNSARESREVRAH